LVQEKKMTELNPALRKLARQTVRLSKSQAPLARVMDLLATNEGDVDEVFARMPQINNREMRRGFHLCAQLLRHFEQELGFKESPVFSMDDADEDGSPEARAPQAGRIMAAAQPSLPGGRAPQRVHVYIDGCSKGNPGISACGVVFTDEKNQIFWQTNRALGDMTNNEAEYSGLITALTLALEHGWKKIRVFSDSQLMVNQMTGVYRIKKKELQQLAKQVAAQIKQLDEFSIEYIPREQNTIADKLANLALK